jgi:hypothetical protein
MAGGTEVSIKGTNLSNATAVDFGTRPATILSNSSTLIVADSPPSALGMVDVTVTTPGGASATSSADQFTFVASPPAITSIAPTQGTSGGGTPVLITGTNLGNATAVDFGTTAATILSDSGTAIEAVSPAEPAGTVAVTVTTANGASATSPADQFTYFVTAQFSAASETVNATAGTFSIPVTVSSTVTPTVSTFASGFNDPNGLAFDAAGNLYVANTQTSILSKVTQAGVVSTFASGDDPEGLAFGAAGNLYVANLGNSTVMEVTPAGVVSTFASGFSDPFELAFDGAGNLYVSNLGNNTVSKVTPAGVVSTFASGFSGPFGAVFDGAGNLYIANLSNNTVSKVTPTGVVSTFASGLSGPGGLAFDAAGNLYVGNLGSFTISKVTTSVSVPFTLSGTAAAGTDYSGVTASPLIIPDGQTTATITGTLLSNPGPSKTLTFTLGTPTGVSLGSPSVNTLSINEPPSVSVPTVTSVSPKPGTAETKLTVLCPYLASAAEVESATTPAIQILSVAPTEIMAVSTPEAVARVDVTAITPEGTPAISTPDQFNVEPSGIDDTLADNKMSARRRPHRRGMDTQ